MPLTTVLTDQDLYAVRSTGTLIQHLEPLSYSQRVREMVQVGQAAATPSGEHLVPVLYQLALSDDLYERLMSVSALKSFLPKFRGNVLPEGIPQAVETLLKDSSAIIVQRAASMAEKLFRSADAVRLVGNLPLMQTKALCKAMLAKRKQTLLDECFKQDAVLNNALRRNVVGCFISESLAESLDAEVFLGFSPKTHASLSRRFPDMMARKIIFLIKTESNEDNEAEEGLLPVSLQAVITVALRVMAKTSHSQKGMTLTVRCLHRLALSNDHRWRVLLPYLALYPAEVCQYVVQHPHVAAAANGYRFNSISTRSLHKIFKLPLELQMRLVDCGFISVNLFASFPVALRARLANEKREKIVDSATGYIRLEYLKYLPTHEMRQAEAKKLFNDPKVDENTRIQALCVFDLKHIETVAAEFIENPDVEVRIACVESIIKSVAYHESTLHDVLNFCVKRKNEQDPYRATVFHALRTLPALLWEAEHLPRVEVLVRAMLTAKDLSEQSARNAGDLLIKIAWKHPEFSASKLLSVLRWGPTSLSQSCILPVDKAKVLIEAMMPLQEEWIHQQNQRAMYNSFLFLHEDIMRKMAPEYERIFKKAMKSKNPSIAKHGMEMYAKYLRPKVLSLLPDLLSAEPDWIFCNSVQEMLSRDLQGTHLSRFVRPLKNIQGKLVPKEREDEVHYVTFSGQFGFRWTCRQQRTYVKTLTDVVTNRPRPNHWVDANIFRLIPCFPSAHLNDGLLPLVASGYEPAYLHALAMAALGSMRDPASLKELCVAIAEEGPSSRAREAIRPLATRLRKVCFEEAIRMLEPVLKCKSITVQKEALVVLGSFGNDLAFARLRQFEEEKGEDLHKDVRVAMLQAYWSFLWKPEVWKIYDEMARGTRAAAAIAVMNIPAELLTAAWQNENFNDLVLTLLRHSDRSVVDAALQRISKPQKMEDPRWYPSIYKLMELVDEPVSQKACNVILTLRVDVEELTQSVSVLSSDAALKKFVSELRSHIQYGVSSPAPREAKIAYSLAVKLLNARRQPSLACQCMMMCYPHVWLELLERMKASGLLHRGAQFAVLDTVSSEIFQMSAPFATALREAEKEFFRHHEDPFFRHVGLSTLTCRLFSEEWPDEARGALLVYQGDEDRWVRDDAKLVVPPRKT